MTPEQRQLAMDLVMMPDGKRAISPTQFAMRFPSALNEGKLALSLLEDVVRKRSADDLQAALVVGFVFGFTRQHTPVLCEVLGATWHFSHEDIVSTLQDLKDSRAVEALCNAAFVSHEYLAYDEVFGLARKCTWVLADIGTPEAKAKLELMAKSENPLVTEYAQKRLDRWADEQHRKKA